MQPNLALIYFIFGGILPGATSRRKQMEPGPCELPRSQGELNSFLWTIQRDPPAYLFGTIHVPYTRVWDFIPENSKAAFQASSSVYFELDLTDPYTISGLASCQMLPHGENLQDVLPRELYRRLKRHLEYVKLMLPHWMTPDQRGKGLYADYLFNAIAGNWERKRPVWVMLMVNSLTETDIRSRGVPVLDLYLAQEAERMKKRTGAVERVEEQCHPLNGLNFSQLPNFINTTLPPHEQVTAQEIDSYFRQELIYKRNERMGKRVMALLKQNTDKSFFFAFGAGHFLGNNTVIDVLRQAGFEVEHTPAGQPIGNSRTKNTSPSSGGSSGTAASAVRIFEHVPVSSPSSMPLQSDEEDSLPPHLLLPDSISQLEEFGRQKKWHKKQHKHHRQRQFNDLWVRIEDSTTTLPSHVRITNGYITVNPPIWFSNQLDQRPRSDLPFHHQPKNSAAGRILAPSITASFYVAIASFLLSLLRPS
ncbi:metalloprotease TIKI2 isoform X3 [Malaclemys terrapin pileata]|uniref:metalloprotease TIKI2 isoform X3 n=1 Tax=Malaclemys terrapin pileata TaxID=2991368 RepID=UPI0023A7BBAF|nr:metalloprotease TIKI2 isoform X3 [Malaclemys terrapin pileata]